MYSSEHGNETSGSIKHGDVADLLSDDYQLLTLLAVSELGVLSGLHINYKTVPYTRPLMFPELMPGSIS